MMMILMKCDVGKVQLQLVWM